jgi:hypothetical protein
MADAAFIDALALYRTQFPTKASLGSGDPPNLWKAEFDKVVPEAFDPVTGTAVTLDSGNVSGVLNFRQMQKFRALHARRSELDAEYINPYTQTFAEPMPPRRLGSVVRLGY